MGIMSSNIFGPSSSADVKNSGESGHHYYHIPADLDILVSNFQQYPIHIRNYLSIDGSIEVMPDGEVLIGEI